MCSCSTRSVRGCKRQVMPAIPGNGSIPGVQPSSSELGILHDIYRAYDPSQTAIIFRDTLIPAFLALFAWITPAGLRDFFG